MDDVENDDDWDLEGAVELDEIEGADAKRRLRELQNSCRSKMRKDLRTVA